MSSPVRGICRITQEIGILLVTAVHLQILPMHPRLSRAVLLTCKVSSHARGPNKDLGSPAQNLGQFPEHGNFMPAIAQLRSMIANRRSLNLPDDRAAELPFQNDPDLAGRFLPARSPLSRKSSRPLSCSGDDLDLTAELN